jgi:hypothetical protein
MLPIMLHSIYHVTLDLLVPIGGCSSNTHVYPHVVLQELANFYFFGILPLGVSILLVQFHCLGVISREKNTKLPKWLSRSYTSTSFHSWHVKIASIHLCLLECSLLRRASMLPHSSTSSTLNLLLLYQSP